MFVFLAFSSDACSTENDLKFERISIDQGLSQSTVFCILQDQTGFMWFGTQDGLNRYDGYEFRIFRHDPADSTSPSDNRIWSMCEDRSGNLWIGALGGGLNKFDREQDRFIRYTHSPEDSNSLSNNNVWTILEDKSGELWVGTENGLNRFNPRSGKFTRYKYEQGNPNSLSGNWVFSIIQDNTGALWIGLLGKGIDKLNPETGQFTHFRHEPGNPNSLSSDNVRTIYEDHSGTIWIGTWGGGLDRFDSRKKSFTHYRSHPSQPYSLSCDTVTSIIEDRMGFLWVGTWGGGLCKFDRNRDEFHRYQTDFSNPNSLSDNKIRALYECRSGIVWIGTEGGGINKYDREGEKFRRFGKIPNNPNSLNDNSVHSIYEDKSGILWIGTHLGGLNRFDRNTGTFKHYTNQPDNLQSLSNNYVSSLHEDMRGRFWCGTFGGGLNLFDRAAEKFKRYRYDPDNPASLSGDIVISIYEDLTGSLWIGIYGGGLCEFNPNDEVFLGHKHDPNNPNSLSDDCVTSIFQDRAGILWLGTDGGGLNRFDREKGVFTRYKFDIGNPRSISSDAVSSILEDEAGMLWVSTLGGGLNKFDRETESFTPYNTDSGLPNNVIYGILEDNQGCLWLSTNNGLSKFDPKIEVFHNYHQGSGLQSDEFNIGAFFKSGRGEMFFGGVNGFNAFFPDSVKINSHIPPVVITEFQIFNRTVKPGIHSPLIKSITETSELKLTHRDKIISFGFAALSYNVPELNQYAYRMEGFDQDWYHIGNRRFATYTNLPAGKFTFMVKGSNNDGVWNEAGASIAITVTPPPWKTWWAYSLYLLALTASVFTFVRVRTKVLADKLEREISISERLRQVDKLKDEFLANTSHELRTPLNGIIGIAESLIDGVAGKPTEKMRANLSLVISSGKRLASLVNDILDFSKLKASDIQLQRMPVDIRALMDVVLRLSEPLTTGKKLALKNEIKDDIPMLDGDENRLQQITHNLIGNAIKFTEKGAVTVYAEEAGGFVKVSVADTGIGIPRDKRDDIFKSFEQADASIVREYGGAGLGLTVSKQLVELHGGTIGVESEPGQGSVFHFTIPVFKGRMDMIVKKKEVSSVRETSDAEFLHPQRIEAGTNGGYRILIVDDEPINQQVLANHLESGNYSITQAMNGPEALKAIESSGEFDLILLDIMMPKMSGYEVCQRIREKYLPSQLPIIMITAKNQVSDLVDGFSAGANDYIAKPFSKSELLSRIKTHLNLHQINTAYGRFVPHEFLKILGRESILDVRLGDQVQGEMTILFSDIRSFTKISESMSPKENFDFLNDYLQRITPSIRKNNGFIDKYIGDAIMALFPQRPENAVSAAIDVLKQVQEYNIIGLQKWGSPINIGIGLNAGKLMLGTIGDKDRMDGTVISDAVNLASRLEGLCKIYGASIAISEHTLNAVDNQDRFHYRFLGKIQVKGKKEVVSVFEIYDGDPEVIIALKIKTKPDFEGGLNAYFQKEFADSVVLFKKVLNANPDDKTARLYLERSAQYVVHGVPEDWEGVETFSSK